MSESIINNRPKVDNVPKINDGIMKSFDNIMFQQEKMDNKAFIFVGFLSVLLGIINKDSVTNSPINWILGTTVLILVTSLLPIANKLGVAILQLLTKTEKSEKHNIFYYIDIYKLDIDSFKKVLQDEYGLGYVTGFEAKLIEQITINAKILRTKVVLHGWAFGLTFIGFTVWGLISLVIHIFKIPI